MTDRPPSPPRRRGLRRALRWLLLAFAAFVGAVLLYLGLAYGLAAIRVDGDAPEPGEPIEIGIYSSPIHTDLVLPVRTDIVDWQAWLPASALDRPFAGQPFVSIGWGDRGFYLEAPQWSDLKVRTALVALTGLGSAVMHVQYRDSTAPYADADGFQMRRVEVGRAHFRRLVEFLQSNFRRDAVGRPIPIPFPPSLAGAYWIGPNGFYEAVGHYSMLRTCNVWTTEAMRVAGLPTPLWSPFPGGVTKHLSAK